MSQQLVLSINNTADNFSWCWLGEGQPHITDSGNLEALKTAIGQVSQQVWLLLPGAKVVTRELEYSEKEKKHLRNLLPYQLEEAVVGDIDDLHFALGEANNGKVALAYTDKDWLRSVFELLGSIGLEITRCWSAPLLLPLQQPATDQPLEPVLLEAEATPEHLTANPAATWVLALNDETVDLRFGTQQGFSLPRAHLKLALALLISDEKLADNLPYIILRAPTQAFLDKLASELPEPLVARISAQILVDNWQLDFNSGAINLCQAEFSQRLPLERWWKLWRNVAILAGVTLVVYLGVLMFNIHKLNVQNVALRQQMEAVYRTVIPNGQSDDPEKRLRIKLSGLQPKAQTGSVVGLLAGVLPLVASNPDITIKLVSYAADSGEMSINVQATSFSSIDGLRQTIAAQGYNAELLTANANTGRLKISKLAH